jgi:beta-lactamase regulating signal transducer with metallopeptidase domain
MLEALFEAALRSFVLTALVWAILKALRLRNPQIQLTAWTIVLIASLAMPIASKLAAEVMPAAPTPQRLIQSLSPPHFDFPATQIVTLERAHDAEVLPGGDRLARLVSGLRALVASSASTVALFLYWAVAGALLARLLAGLWLTWRIVRAAKPVTESWTSSRDIRASDAIGSPATFGSTILLPSHYWGWSEAKRSAVLAHEAAHIERADFYIHIAASLNRIIFWFSPGSWWLERKLSILAEAASDDAAIIRLRDRPGYAEILLDVSHRSPAPRGGVAMARTGTISQRINRILAETALPTRITRRSQIALAVALSPFVVVAAGPLAQTSPPIVPATVVDEQVAPHHRISIDPVKLDAEAGFYEDKTSGWVLTVKREDDHLVVARTGKAPVPEYPYSDHDFFLTTTAEQDSFVGDDSGAIRVIRKRYGLATPYERISADRAAQLEADYSRRLAEELQPRTPIRLDAGELDRYVGYYRLNSTYTFTITREGDQLYAQGTEQNRFAVFPYSDRDFFYTAVAAQLSFQTSGDGPATGLILHQDGRDRPAQRISAEAAKAVQERLSEEIKPRSTVPVDGALLDRYVGHYANPNIAMAVTREGDHLLAQVLGFNKYRVYPYTDHDFFATTFAAQISFVRGADDKVVRLVRHEHGEDVVLDKDN